MSHDARYARDNLTAKEIPVIDARPAAEIRSNHHPAGFTLVELLVVIGIIALLAALITPAVIGARTSARNAAIKAEIDMLHMAIMNYKNEYGSFPPCQNLVAGPTGRASLAYDHLRRVFPRLTATKAVVQQYFDPPGLAYPSTLSPSNALFMWLRGFSDDPTQPLSGVNPRRLFDFDQTRVSQADSATKTPAGQYFPSGKRGSPYLYLDAAAYLSPPPGFVPQRSPTAAGRFDDPSQPFLNPDTFQILCAGLDEVIGTEDDLSNCWSGTRKQYLDSLKQ